MFTEPTRSRCPLKPHCLQYHCLFFGVLELLPPSGILLTTSLFPGDLAKLPVPLSLERTNAAPGDNQCLPGIGGDRRKMDLSQVYSGMNIAWNSFCLHNLNAHV